MASKSQMVKSIEKVKVPYNKKCLLEFHLIVDKTDPPESQKVFNDLKFLSAKPKIKRN